MKCLSTLVVGNLQGSTQVMYSNESFLAYPRCINLTGALTGALKKSYGAHRSGWSYAMQSLNPLHTDLGIWLDPFVEKKFVWGMDYGERRNNPQPYRQEWIGFMHVPPKIPKWFQFEQSPHSFFKTDLWRKSSKYCRGLFCLSSDYKDWLSSQVNIPVANLLHPTETPIIKFSFDVFIRNSQRKIVQIGWWLRKLHSIYYLPNQKIKKAIVNLNTGKFRETILIEKHLFSLSKSMNEVAMIDYLSNDDYDILLSQNIVYLDLYNSIANNVIVECIVRNTPILVNSLPAVREYLGEDYPFYFHSLREAAQKADNFDLIEETYYYLKEYKMKEKLTGKYFLNSFFKSEIYQSLISRSAK